MAQIQFSRGVTEEVIPEIRLTRSRDEQTARAIFHFNAPQIFNQESQDPVTGMYLIDEEGEIVTQEVKGKFVNGKPTSLEGILVMNSPEEWDRFMRFMERYAEEHGLQFTQAK
jgi:photosystem II protein